MAKMAKVTHRKEQKTYPVPKSMNFSKVSKKGAEHQTHGAGSKKKK